jgi:hypothetical protein
MISGVCPGARISLHPDKAPELALLKFTRFQLVAIPATPNLVRGNAPGVYEVN